MQAACTGRCAPSCSTMAARPRVCKPTAARVNPAPCVLHRSMLSRRRVACSAAAGGDPWEVLGIKPDATNLEITKAYNRAKSKARGNASLTAKIEEAHSRIMMAAFNARLKSGSSVPKEIKYADREQLFPWRPKRWDATPQVMMIFGALQLGLVAFAFQAPNIQKAMGCMLVGIAGNVMKQNAIFPPPEDPDMATEEEAGRPGRNFVRGALLGLLATFAGILLLSAPEYLQQALNIVLPVEPGRIVALKVAGSGIFNWIMTSYYY